MKKIFIIIVFFFLTSFNIKASPNPIVILMAKVEINELYFDDQGEWKMELLVWFPDFVPFSDTAVKQIRIVTSGGQADVLHFNIISPVSYLLISKDSLSIPLYINPEDDYIEAITSADGWFDTGLYYGVWDSYSYMDFGTSNSLSMIPEIPQGCSVSLFDNKYYLYLDNSPTLGFPNDTVGGLGQIHGKMYDYVDHVFTSGNFKIQSDLGQFLQFNEDSTYTAFLLSNKYIYGYITYFMDSIHTWAMQFDHIHTNILPGNTYNFDIHLIDSGLVVGLREQTSPEIKRILVAPNPFSTNLQLFIELNSLPGNSDLIIYDSFGKEVLQIELPNEITCKISVPGERLGKRGAYYYRITQRGKTIASGKLLYI